MTRYAVATTALLSLLLAGGNVSAGEWDLGGSVSVESRGFLNEPGFADQDDTRLVPSAALEPEFVYEWRDGDDRLTFTPFARRDAEDENRNHLDVRAANWLHVGDGWDLVAGIDTVFWGVTESRHLVDIVNQTDAVEDIDGEDKLGQPMLNLNLEGDRTTVGLFILPGFREQVFPGDDARLRGAIRVADDEVTFDSGAEEGRIDFAARWSGTFGNWDLGLSHFSGTSREPRFTLGTDGSGPILIPHYDVIEQTGLDLQLTTERWLWKIEAISRAGHGDRFLAAVGGFEYSFYGVVGTDADLGLIAEYLHDGRDDDGSAPVTPMDDDIFLGARLAFNDEQSTELLAGAVIDRESGATLASLEAERRLGDRWKLELEGRFFIDIAAGDPLAGLAKDDFATLRLTMFF